LKKNFCLEIEKFAKINKISVLGRIPYKKDFIKSTIKMKPVVEINPKYKKLFQEIINQIKLAIK
jgi:MinD superfamily P-loop ATPase